MRRTPWSTEIACSLLVALAEEGWTDGPTAESVARAYLAPVLVRPVAEYPDTVVLGCTHFPLLEGAIRTAIGPGPTIVDSATTTAAHVARLLDEGGLRRRTDTPPSHVLLATDGPERFAKVGAAFLGEPLRPADVEVVNL